MAMSVDLLNVNPNGALELNLEGESVLVGAAETLTCTPEAAGRAPSWQPAGPAEVGLYATGLLMAHTRIISGRLEVFDLGTGLLAQTENWRALDADHEPASPTDPGDGSTLNTDAGMEN